MTNGNHKSWEDAVEQAYRGEQVRFCTDYLREHCPGFYQQPQQHYEERMDQLEWARTALLKLVKKEQE